MQVYNIFNYFSKGYNFLNIVSALSLSLDFLNSQSVQLTLKRKENKS